MLYIKILLIVVTLALIIRVLIKYDPKFDFVENGNKINLLLWYNKYDWYGNKVRTYIQIY